MVNLLTKSIGAALQTEFGDGYEIYREGMAQTLKESCFSVFCIGSSMSQQRQARYYRENQFCIRYFPRPGGHGREECHSTAERMFSCLRWLDCRGVPVMGTGMKYEILDGILHFSVNYNMFSEHGGILPTMMEELTDEISVRGEEKSDGKESS